MTALASDLNATAEVPALISATSFVVQILKDGWY